MDVSRPLYPDPASVPIAEKLHDILLDGIEVHVEWMHSSENPSTSTIEEMLLWFDNNLNRLEVCPVNEAPIAKNTRVCKPRAFFSPLMYCVRVFTWTILVKCGLEYAGNHSTQQSNNW